MKKQQNRKTKAKRKDAKGRVLRTGESQRPDGRYEFRYSDGHGRRRSLYALTLEELRQKEQELQACQALGHQEETSVAEVRKKEAELLICTALGIDPNQPDITVEELIREYVDLKRNVRYATRTGYHFVQGVVAKYPFAKQSIRSIKVTDAKRWIIQLHEDGYAWNSIASIRGVLRPAFQMAFNEERIRRNPFDFRLDFIPNDSRKRVALSKLQQEQFLDFIRENVIPLPKITPHVFRHTFCTNMANAGMDLKSLQYLMGHADVSVTLNVYAHSSYEKAEAEMSRIATFSKKSQSKARKRKA